MTPKRQIWPPSYTVAHMPTDATMPRHALVHQNNIDDTNKTYPRAQNRTAITTKAITKYAMRRFALAGVSPAAGTKRGAYKV